MDKVHFYGEFGYLHFSILGALQRLFVTKPNQWFEIATYPEYYELLNFAFPGRFILANDLPDMSAERGLREGNWVKTPKMRLLHERKFQVLSNFMGLRNYGHLVDTIYPLLYKLPDEFKDRQLISICCRKRTHAAFRNLSQEMWASAIATIHDIYPEAILVFHGLPTEMYDFSHLPFAKSIYSTLDSIGVLNRSICLVTCVTGFEHFAMNCRCRSLQIGNPTTCYEYNPFKRMRILLEPKHFNKLGDAMRIFSGTKTHKVLTHVVHGAHGLLHVFDGLRLLDHTDTVSNETNLS